MIKHAYIIQAHKNPDQLFRMINALRDDNVKFFIHIDLKSNIAAFSSRIKGEDIVFIRERIDCIWGDFSQVQATLHLISAVLASNCDDRTRVTFLSGQDYPIKSKGYIAQFLEDNALKDFITIENLEDSGAHHLKRISAFKINHSNERSDYTLVSLRYIKGVIKSLFMRKLRLKDLTHLFKAKKYPLMHKQYRGSNWWSLNVITLNKIVDYYQQHKNVLNDYYEKTICSDETFFHTIIMHLQRDDKGITIDSSLTYDNWTRKQAELPVTFEKDDISELLHQPSNKLFARKFDTEKCSEILNKLDQINK